MEIWKNVSYNFYSDTYQVSTKGNVWRTTKKIPMKFSLREGYPSICLSKQNKKKTFHIHRLVAQSFLKNPKSLPYVNHKDADRCNNNYNNLEWVTAKENVRHSINNNLSKGNSLKVSQYDINDNKIDTFSSIKKAAQQTGCCAKKISAVCKKKRKTTGGFIWKYVDKNIDNPPENSRSISGYDNYLITTDGKIYNKKYQQYMKPHIHTNGYHSIGLSNNGKKEFYIHQLVCQVFKKNPDNKKFVNHKNGKKDDNRIENLEWVTCSENMKHANEFLNFAYKKCVIQYDMNGKEIKSFSSVKNASKNTGIDQSSIIRVCKQRKQKSAGGFLWKYDDSPNLVPS